MVYQRIQPKPVNTWAMSWSILTCVWLALCFFVFSDWAQQYLQHIYVNQGFRGQFSLRYADMDQQRIMFLLYTSVPGLSWLWANLRDQS